MHVDHTAFLGMKAPRYTSYPPALHFKQMSPSTHQEWITAFGDQHSLALYIHIPFCRQLCWFCACHTQITHNDDLIRAYCYSICDELELIRASTNNKIKVHSIHFGGGSPSLVPSKELEQLLNKIHSIFTVLPDAEIAIEADPRTLDADKISDYHSLGFNRISLGVQDLDDTVQEMIHRKCSLRQLQTCCDTLRAVGLQHINFDLIYGLPYQTLNSLKETIDLVHLLNPSRIAFYSFAHLPHLKKHHKILEPITFPSENTKGAMYIQASAWLQNYGYTALGMDHFVKNEDDLLLAFQTKKFRRNFMGYTASPNEYVLGLGISAVSQLEAGFSQNSVTRPPYVQAIQNGHLATQRGWIDSQEDKLRRYIIQELMCYFTVDIPSVLEKFGYKSDHLDAELNLLQNWVEHKVISIKRGNIIFLSPLRMLIRFICAAFDSYHCQVEQQRYSKVG